MTDIVIGSGPAGVAAAKALLARGRKVRMLDGGRTPEAKAVARRDALAAQDPQAWTAEQRRNWMEPQFSTPPGQVRRFGSDFAMEHGDATIDSLPDWFALRASHAAGGLSNLWGSAVLPYSQQDIGDWPITAEDLAPHYRAVADFIPVAGGGDGLDRFFTPLANASRPCIPPSIQAEALLARLSAKEGALAERGVFAGVARQAVRADCRRCGLCLHGCPFGMIWSARETLTELRANPDFDYQPNAVVRRIAETADGVTLHLDDGTSVGGARAFLGAGVLETARILLASGHPRNELLLKDSQHAFLPMIQRWRNRQRPDRLPFHTLPQLFVEMNAPQVSARLIHAQLYTWNEHFYRDLNANYGQRLPFTRPALALLSRHLIVAQLFLHSDHSHRIGLSLAPDGRLRVRLERNPDTEQVLTRAGVHLARAMNKVGLTALNFARRAGPPGSSFHAGSTLPMAASGGGSDLLGRPNGMNRVHVIDASVLPSIPATTITFSVMANAHRIGSLAP